jgi:hypothetical protein
VPPFFLAIKLGSGQPDHEMEKHSNSSSQIKVTEDERGCDFHNGSLLARR